MYDIQQFKPSLYLVVLLGLTGYALAAESPAVWVFAVALVLTNLWLVRQGAFRPIPRAVANVITVGAFAWAFLQIRTRGVDSPILAIGQFLVLLQVVKVWEQRANRDYAQLLVLSLLLMVAAAISTASLLFGVIFVAYLLVVLYCCLLFHLKMETEEAHANLLQDGGSTAAGEGRAGDGRAGDGRAGDGRAGEASAIPAGDRRALSASIRRLTGLIAAYALVAAVVTFLFFPRGAGAGMFGQFVWRPRKTLTGFSEQVNFQSVARITQSNDQVGTVRILGPDGKPRPFAGPLLLRGSTDDYYSGGNDDGDRGKYQWSHAPGVRRSLAAMRPSDGEMTWRLPRMPEDAPVGSVHQEVDLNPTGTPVLFAVAGADRLTYEDVGGRRPPRVLFGRADQTLRTDDSITRPVRYLVDSTGALGDEPTPPHAPSVIDPAIAAFARRPAVTGDLPARRDADAAAHPGPAPGGGAYVSPLDAQIADRVAAYLRRNYAYTLDLTNAEMVEGRDPMAAFLTDFKRGHCEYFAGAMTLMCQSLGLQARLVVGFKVDEYNNFGNYYTVRQSHAHAWVEVRTAARGWQTYDPTGGGADAGVAAASTWQRARNLLDFMEYTWQRAVISYNADNRDNLIQDVNAKLTRTTYSGSTSMAKLRDALSALGDWAASHVVGPIIGVLVVGLLAAVGYFTLDRYRMRQRAARIGLAGLPPDDQARLVRQLAFYDELVQLLGRHRVVRPPHQTPLEFVESLSFLPANAYGVVRRLTAVFYRVRYGGAQVDDGLQRRLMGVVGRLEKMMPAADA